MGEAGKAEDDGCMANTAEDDNEASLALGDAQ
jgi:hypothetical protein